MNGLYKGELIFNRGPWRTVEDVELATLAWVHWRNTTRFTRPSATFHLRSSRPLTTLTNSRLSMPVSTKPSLYRTRGGTHRREACLRR